ncbi:MAG TPA: hypothetical protein PL181_16280 [bacterium]|nr:hypothetical protein [bacterium]
MKPAKRIGLIFIVLLLIHFMVPIAALSEDPTPCDLAFVDCLVETGGWWIWQFACVIGWAWCVTYVEPYA